MMTIRFNIIGDDSEAAREIERKIAAPFKHHAMLPRPGDLVKIKGEDNTRYAVSYIKFVGSGADLEIIVGIQ